MHLTWATDEITTYLNIPTGFNVDINGLTYTVLDTDDAGLDVQEYTEGDEVANRDSGTGPIQRFEWDDVETLHII